MSITDAFSYCIIQIVLITTTGIESMTLIEHRTTDSKVMGRYMNHFMYIWRYGLPWHKVLNAVVAELSIHKLKNQRRRIDSL